MGDPMSTGRTMAALLRRAPSRVAGAVSVLLASTAITFLAMHAMPGDVVSAILGGPSANPTPEAIAAAVKEYGLDRPVLAQYALYLGRLLHGDLGTSFTQHRPVAAVLGDQLLPTLELTASALLTAWMLALVSVLCTTRRHPLLSRLGSGLEATAAALPPFWLGILLLSLFAFTIQLFPPAGSDGLATLVLPTLTLAIPLGGFLARVTREALELALDQPFILSARLRGLGEFAVRMRHALRHALLPGISLSAWAFGVLIGNAVVTEVIFSRKGIGRQLLLAVTTQDMPLAMGIVLLVTLSYILSNLAADGLFGLVDPRLKAANP
jgi:peptide/nickel transport system permease protein